MGFSSINTGGLKLGNIKTYNNQNTANTVFKNQFYSDIEEIDYGSYEEIDYNNTVDLEKGIETTLNEKEWYEIAASTGCVTLTTVVSGVLKIREVLEDGLTWLSGMAVSGVARLFGKKEFAENFEQKVMDEISRDKVGELNEFFYENTEIGRSINEASAMKYDSELAKGIQNVTTEVVIIAGATAATVVTGGAAAPLFAAGFVIGAGQSAEEKFQDKENRDFWKDSVEIGVDGTIKGLSTVAAGKAGATAVNGIKTLVSNGLKNTIKETLGAFSKDAIKATIKTSGKTLAKRTVITTLKDKDTWLETGAVLLDDVKTGIQTGEWNIMGMICESALIYGENYIGNLAGGILSDSVKKIDRLTELYKEGQDAAIGDYNVGFKSYREHAEKHVYYVASYMQDISKNVDDINLDEALFGALSHDLGMKGGYVKVKDVEILDMLKKHGLDISDGDYIKADKLLDILKTNGKDISFGDIANYVRKPHPLNSALTVLTDDIVPEGVDKDVVALLAMSHSKSTSGITYFDNADQWNNCVDDLEKALKQYNHDNNTSFTLDTQKLKNMINDPDEFTRLQKEALIIRDGDAMSKVATSNGDTIMQTGNVSHIENTTPRKSYNDVVVDEETELAGLTDNLKTIDGKDVENGDVSSGVKFHVGELNTKFSSQTDGISYYSASVELVEPNQTPHSTLFAIEERVGEVNTYSNCVNREFVVNLPKEAEGTSLGDWYKNEVEVNLRNSLAQKAEAQLTEGIIDRNTYNKQLDFYKNIKVNFG